MAFVLHVILFGILKLSMCVFMFSYLEQGNATPPAAVTIFFGANDAALLTGTGKKQHVPLEEYKENLRKMVQHIKVLFYNLFC